MRVYRMAERNIGVESLHERVHALCAAYAVDAAPDMVVRVTQADIDRERVQAAREARRVGRPVQPWDDGYLEELAVYRKIAERMPAYDTFLFHGSAVAVDGQGYLFVAPSGTGKSTHAQLWQELLGPRFRYVNDDKPLIRIAEGAVYVYGTPYDGKHHRSEAVVVPLRALCLLQRGRETVVRPLAHRDAFPRLLGQVYRPQDRAAMARTVALLQALTERVALYELSCAPEADAARTAFEGMGGTLG